MSLSIWAASLGERLAPHVTQLRRGLASLGERLRQSIANSVGRAVADVVTEAVDAALATPDDQGGSYRPSLPASVPVRSRDWWDRPGDSTWDRPEDGYDPYDRAYRDYDDGMDQDRDEAPQPRDDAKPGRLGRALAAGLQAAGWWMQRHRGRLSLGVAAGVGLATGIAALLDGGPFGITGLVASALGLLALDGVIRSGADALGDARP